MLQSIAIIVERTNEWTNVCCGQQKNVGTGGKFKNVDYKQIILEMIIIRRLPVCTCLPVCVNELDNHEQERTNERTNDKCKPD